MEIMAEEKEKLENALYHYGHCVTAMDDLKRFIVSGKDTNAVNKLKDIQRDLTKVGHWIKDVHDAIH